MNNEGGLVPTNLAEVIEKFNGSIRKFALKETEWLVLKGGFETRIAELEGQVKAHENINIRQEATAKGGGSKNYAGKNCEAFSNSVKKSLF